jgi:anaerobic magnesium-protoporphyrin IX monomethyl ester cyclase
LRECYNYQENYYRTQSTVSGLAMALTRVGLIYPPYHYHPPAWPFSRPTLVLAHLYAVLESQGFTDVSVFDLDLEFTESHQTIEYYIDQAMSRVEQKDPQILCLSCKVAQFPFVTLFSRQYKQVHPEVKIVVGGWMPTLSPDVTLRMAPCDAVIRGEGERSLPQLLQGITDDAWTIKGVSYLKKGNQVIHNPNAEPLTQVELDKLPLPRYDVLPPLHRYQPKSPKVCYSVQASRGCINHQCIFCWNSTQNCVTSWRARSPQRVVEEIRLLVDTYRAQVFFFTDDSFGADGNWLHTFTSLMKREFHPGQIEYVASMRVDSVIPQKLPDLFASGMRTIFHGIESGSPRCWTLLGKNFAPSITRQSIIRLIEQEIQNRLSPICSFIVAFPGETEADLDQTISLCEELALRGSIFSLQVLAPNEGTTLYYDPQYTENVIPLDLYQEFGESENINPEQRNVFGEQLDEFKTSLPDFRLIRPSMPFALLKEKYAHLGDIASYEGLIQRRFKVFNLANTEHNLAKSPMRRIVGKAIGRLVNTFRQRDEASAS